jgi:TPR repeat protein
MRRWIAAVAAVASVALSATALAQNPNLRPMVGEGRLGGGQEVWGDNAVAGGPNQYSDCPGWYSDQPTGRFTYNGDGRYVAVMAASEQVNLTLLIQEPSGQFYCIDDADGFDPALFFTTSRAGAYNVWVGTYGQSNAGTYTVSFVAALFPNNDGSVPLASDYTAGGGYSPPPVAQAPRRGGRNPVVQSSGPAVGPRTGGYVDPSAALRAVGAISDQEWQLTRSSVLLDRVVSASSPQALLAAADQGDADAQALVGRAYDGGAAGFPDDPFTSAAYYQAAAEQGQVMAINNLGFMYDIGRGVPEDPVTAAYYFAVAADLGSAFGQSNLASMYVDGRGVEQSDAEAFRLYRLASDRGHPPAQAGLAWMYQNGRGVRMNMDEAVRLYRIAARAGDEQAIEALSQMGLSW